MAGWLKGVAQRVKLACVCAPAECAPDRSSGVIRADLGGLVPRSKLSNRGNYYGFCAAAAGECESPRRSALAHPWRDDVRPCIT